MAGILYLVGTPIGNLEDMTFRGVRVLKEAAVIACEDTRQTRKLLDHYGIERPTLSYHDHNELSRTPELIERLQRGECVALVSDAGMPLVADPGYRLVRAAIEAGIAVQAIPGASALVTALAAAGLPTDAFYFGGFLPPKAGARRAELERLAGMEATLVFYEAPHRILETLEEIAATLGERPAAVARELTKLHEEILRGTVSEIRDALAARPTVKGEITLLVAKAPAPPPDETPLADAVDALVREGAARMDAIKAVARRRGLSKREVYDAVERTK